MPTRNINLTDHYESYLTQVLASGRYKNASEVVRAALLLLERQDKAKLESLRDAFKEGEDAYNRGDFDTLRTDAEIDRYFDQIAEEVRQAR